VWSPLAFVVDTIDRSARCAPYPRDLTQLRLPLRM